ncbi:MAG: YIP1 family protein [Vicinamibacteria bacterium]|nr:YIP1 family protein [Vicinamibacteria bacterium]
MTDEQPVGGSGPAAPEAPGDSFVSALLDVYLAPREGFAQFLRLRSFWLPLGLLIALNVAFTAWWVPKADVRGMVRAQLEEQGMWDRFDAEQRGRILDQQEAGFRYVAWPGAVLGSPIVVFVLSGFFLFVYRFFYGSDVVFRDCLVVTSCTFFAVGLLHSPAIVATLLLKDDWTLNPQQALQASPAGFFEPGALPPWLGTLFAGLDLFVLWTLFLLAAGFGVASKRATLSAAWGVVIPYALILMSILGLRLLMSAL